MGKLKLLFMFCLLLLTGCTADYKITIKEDNKITETIVFKEKKDILLTYSSTVSMYLNSELKNINNESKYDNYNKKVKEDSLYGIGEGERNYTSYDDYKNNSTIIKEMFKDVSITETDNKIIISMKPVDEFVYLEDTSLYSSLLDEVNIEINSPYNVLENNSDKTIDNSYVWNIKKGETLKDIYIVFDTSLKSDNIPLYVWIAIVIISFIILIGLYIFIRYKKYSM